MRIRQSPVPRWTLWIPAGVALVALLVLGTWLSRIKQAAREIEEMDLSALSMIWTQGMLQAEATNLFEVTLVTAGEVRISNACYRVDQLGDVLPSDPSRPIALLVPRDTGWSDAAVVLGAIAQAGHSNQVLIVSE